MKPVKYFLLFLSLGFVPLIFSCNYPSSSSDGNKKDTLNVCKEKVKQISALEKKLIDMGLVDVHKLDTSITIEIKYSTTDNFMNRDMYGDFDKAYLQKDVAENLVKSQKYLDELMKGYKIIIYDATRPQSVQQYMWDSVNISYSKKVNYLANPLTGSLHSYGCAVDISILDNEKKPLDMGTPFDYMGVEASSENESSLLKDGKLTQQQIDNRKLLRQVMQHADFFNVHSEWWHFNACRIEEAKKKYKIIE
ncbi:MAG: M15 family metallopeptidase [Bacteroidota bacterium]